VREGLAEAGGVRVGAGRPGRRPAPAVLVGGGGPSVPGEEADDDHHQRSQESREAGGIGATRGRRGHAHGVRGRSATGTKTDGPLASTASATGGPGTGETAGRSWRSETASIGCSVG